MDRRIDCGRKRKDHRGFIYKDKLFFHGGQDDSGLTTNSMDIYKPDSEVWAKGIRGGRKRKIMQWLRQMEEFIVGVDRMSSENALNNLDVYNLDPWQRGVSGGDGRTDHNAIAVDGKMYIWNGFGTGNFINNVDVYDLENRTWMNNIDTPTLLDSKSGASSCIMSGPSNISWNIFFGEEMEVQNPNKIQVYDLANQQFITTGPIVGENREYASANCYNGKVYIWGGRPASGIVTNQLDIFDVSTQQLDTGVNHNGGTARFGHTASLHNGKIYIWGGRVSQTGRINTMDIYDIESSSWSSGANGGTPRSDHSAVIFEDKIFYYGGSVNTGAQKLDTIDVYDITENEWQEGSEGRLAYEGSSDNAKRRTFCCSMGWAYVHLGWSR